MKSGEKKKRFISADRGGLALGLALVAFSFVMPLLFNVENFGILTSMKAALAEEERTELMQAALLLVALNAIRGVPHYVGAFFIGESLRLDTSRRFRGLLNAALTLVILLIVYRGIDYVHHVHYDFGIPAFIVSAFVILFVRLGYRYISRAKKAALTALMLTAFQFLDIMPLVGGLPVGRGETSLDIKTAAEVLDCEGLLNAAGLTGVMLFSLFGLIILFQFRAENSLRKLDKLKEQNEEIRLQAHLAEVENRTYREMQYLVHDLKSPLTAIQTISGILRMESEQGAAGNHEKDAEYFDRIEAAVDQMSGMISEILYENRRSPVTTQALLNIVLSQASAAKYAPYVRAENAVPGKKVLANRILFPRAVQNLVENAFEAVESGKTPEIVIRVGEGVAAGVPQVLFSVSDNGRGIPASEREKIFERGVSGGHSSGLGLSFVKKVVGEMGGTILLASEEKKGTTFTIRLPEEEEETDE